MIKRTSDLIGKPVVSIQGGEKLGTVTDLLLDEGRLVGLVLRHGWMNQEHVLPAAAVQTFGTDAVVSRTSELIGAKEWREREQVSESPVRDEEHRRGTTDRFHD